ncbi:MAG: DUF2244 domain-containing protein [Gammaproteobacteria bacterium]
MRYSPGALISVKCPCQKRDNILVARQVDNFQGSSRFLIRPNCSLPWRGVVRFYIGMVVVSFGIAIAFALNGAWLILPFAGLEMLILGAALYVVARRGSCWQAVSIHGDQIEVVSHDPASEQQQTFQRAWAQVKLQQARINGYPSQLTIRSHGRTIEIGGCLAEKEKEHLALELRQAMRPPSTTGLKPMSCQDAVI